MQYAIIGGLVGVIVVLMIVRQKGKQTQKK